MRNRLAALLASLTLGTAMTFAQSINSMETKLQAVSVSYTTQELENRKTIVVTKDPTLEAVDEPTFVKLVGTEFKNGTIEVEVLSKLLPDAPAHARGFIGVAFRIDESNSRFESIYLRPTNARADDQLRRNRATQYFSYPDFKFDRLRKEAPGQYESYADMALNEWITLKIVVRDSHASLYLNGSAQPVLVVTDLKHGAHSSGAIGLWVDVGTQGHFSNIRITPAP